MNDARKLYDNAVVTPVFKEWYLESFEKGGKPYVRAQWDVTVTLRGTMPLEFNTGFRDLQAPKSLETYMHRETGLYPKNEAIVPFVSPTAIREAEGLIIAVLSGKFVTPERKRIQDAVLKHLRPKEPTKFDILYCLCSDTGIAETCGTFEGFCAELGYDEDSRKAEATWKAVLEQTNRFRSIGATQELCDLLRDIDHGDQPK